MFQIPTEYPVCKYLSVLVIVNVTDLFYVNVTTCVPVYVVIVYCVVCDMDCCCPMEYQTLICIEFT